MNLFASFDRRFRGCSGDRFQLRIATGEASFKFFLFFFNRELDNQCTASELRILKAKSCNSGANNYKTTTSQLLNKKSKIQITIRMLKRQVVILKQWLPVILVSLSNDHRHAKSPSAFLHCELMWLYLGYQHLHTSFQYTCKPLHNFSIIFYSRVRITEFRNQKLTSCMQMPVKLNRPFVINDFENTSVLLFVVESQSNSFLSSIHDLIYIPRCRFSFNIN